MENIIIAIDGEGGDHAPGVIAQALSWAVKHFDNVIWQVYCYKESAELFKKAGVQPIICEKTEGDTTTSTMQAVVRDVKEKRAHACVSAGNTIFYFVEAIRKLPKFPLIKRPALITSMPSKPRDKIIIDVGANLQCSAFDMAMFAVMGRIYAENLFGRENPQVSFLNVGSEQIKGPAYIREARGLYNQIFNASNGYNEADFIEGDEVFSKDTDIVVMDGFTGNVLIKFAKGMSKFLFNALKATAKKSVINMIYGLFAKRLLKGMSGLDYQNHNSAILMGIDGLVIKAQGSSNAKAFASTLVYAVKMAGEHEEICKKLKEYSGKVAQVNI